MTWTIKMIHDRCTPDGECMVWKGGLNSAGYPMVFLHGTRYATTTGRLIAILKIGLDQEDLPKFTAFRGWPTCGNKRCCAEAHIMGGTVLEHRGWLRQQGRTERSPEHRAKLTEARRSRDDVKLSPEKAQAIREARACGETRDSVARRFGVCTDTVRKITNGLSWRQQVSGASVFNLR